MNQDLYFTFEFMMMAQLASHKESPPRQPFTK
jgi:hypothetical protein